MSKIDQIKSWFFEKINKLIYSRQLDKEKKEENTSYMSEKRYYISVDIRKIIRNALNSSKCIQ